MGRWHDGGDWGTCQWVAMALLMFVLWSAVVAVIIALRRRPGVHHDSALRASHENAERIHAERFARGRSTKKNSGSIETRFGEPLLSPRQG